MHHRLLALWEQGLVSLSLRTALQDSRAADPMFLLFRLLRPLYRKRPENGIPVADIRVSAPARMCPKRRRSAESLTPSHIRGIRKALGFSQGEFAHILWVTYSTLSRWEHGHAPPFGMHLRILSLLEQNLSSPYLKATLRSPRRADHLFLLHQLLEPLYSDRPIIKPRHQ
jgi:DNA-binding transcriptional regulator YiaG